MKLYAISDLHLNHNKANRQSLRGLPNFHEDWLIVGGDVADSTESWHTRCRLDTAVYGQLHIRGTYQRDQTQFMEVSQGYPQNWDTKRRMAVYLKQILPKPILNCKEASL